MKSILLFRHGQAGWGQAPFGIDHEKPLTPNGITEAEKMGKHLFEINTIPDLIISSTARRAKNTIQTAVKSGQWNAIINYEAKIYGGKPNFLLDLINEQNDKYNLICLVGHEPNFSSFVSLATGEYKIFSTASVAKIDFNTNNWNKICFQQGSLNWLVSPSELK